MASYRKLPSGLWQATVRHPSGKRITHTDKLKKVVQKWATEQEANFNKGRIHNPRDGQIKISAWYERWSNARGHEAPTMKNRDSYWRTHCKDQWGEWPMNAVSRMEAQQWVNKLRVTPLARHKGKWAKDQTDVPLLSPSMVCEAVHLMTTLYNAAMEENPPLVELNPFRKLELPTNPPPPVQYYEHEEKQALYAAIERLHGRHWRILVELGMDVGLRPGEIYGLHGHRLDLARGQLDVTHVMTRAGIREYPKSEKSHRSVPIPPDVLDGLTEIREGKSRWEVTCTCPKVLPNGKTVPGNGPCPGLVFSAPAGGPIDDGNFRDRIWYTAVAAARTCGGRGAVEADDPIRQVAAGRCGAFCDDQEHRVRRFPPRIMRHTAASSLVQAGVPLFDVQELLGHEDSRTTQKYAHLAPGAHSAVRNAWKQRDASVTHEDQKAGPLVEGTGS